MSEASLSTEETANASTNSRYKSGLWRRSAAMLIGSIAWPFCFCSAITVSMVWFTIRSQNEGLGTRGFILWTLFKFYIINRQLTCDTRRGVGGAIAMFVGGELAAVGTYDSGRELFIDCFGDFKSVARRLDEAI